MSADPKKPKMKTMTHTLTQRITLLLMALLLTLGMQAATYTIYPVPQKITMGTSTTQITQRVNILADATIDQATLDRAREVVEESGRTAVFVPALVDDGNTTLLLATIGSGSEAEQVCTDMGLASASILTAGKYDRHGLLMGGTDIAILGEHTNAVFFGLASLEQILEQQADDGNYTDVTIYDYADQQNRGLVEGYYGYPYSVEVKKDLMQFMKRHKMNTYMYGAKSDPYHSQYWKDAYPASITAQQEKNGWLSQAMVSDIAATSEATKVNFIWAIHPGNNFLGSSTVINDIMTKFQLMHDLGVRQFAVFVDDVSIPSSDADMKLNADRIAALQQSIETRWNQAGAEATDTVRPLHFVPQIYCSSFASSDDQRQRFMAALGKTPSHITVYTTGQGVWTVPNSGHMVNMHNELGRDMAWWWNYPCNDNADGQIYTMDMYSNFYDLPAVDGNSRMPSNLTNTIGVVSNPMQEGEVAKTALFSVADYAWNNSGFNNDKSWQASFKSLIGDETIREAYRFLTRYLRWNEPTAVKTLIASYKTTLTKGAPNSASLQELMTQIVDNCTVVEGLKTSAVQSDRLLYDDLRPWLLKLKADCQVLKGLLQVAESEEDLNTRWQQYLALNEQVRDLKTNGEYTVYALEGMGNGISTSSRQAQLSQLYLEPFISYMSENAMYGSFLDQRPAKAQGITNKSGLTVTAAQTSSGVFYMAHSIKSFQPGEYVGIKLPQNYKLSQLTVADTLFANHTLLCSENGKEWTRLTSATEAPSSHLRYLVVVNATDLPRSWKLTSKTIQLTPQKPTAIASVTIPSGTEYSGHPKENMIDGDYTTWFCLNRNQQTGDKYTIDLGEAITVEDVRVCMGTVNGDYMTHGQVQISSGGTMWTTLKVMGTSNTDYTLSLPQNVKYNDEMTYCDFDGEGRNARYVRLNVKTANTNKWLRLYDIEVNRTSYDRAFRQVCTTIEGDNLSNVIDGNGGTALASTVQSPVDYRLEEMARIQGLTVYTDPANGVKPLVSVTSDGEFWTPVATLSEACQYIDLTDYPEARTVRFEWEGDTAPALCEVVPAYDESEVPSVLTAVESVSAAAQPTAGTCYNLLGQPVAHPRRGLYIQNHRVRIVTE